MGLRLLPALLLALLAALTPLVAPARLPGRNTSASQGNGTSNNQFAGDAPHHQITLSLTLTPMGVIDDAERMALTETIMQHLQAEWLLREADGQLTHAGCTRERGDLRQEAHLQAAYDLNTTHSSPEALRKLMAAEKAHLKKLLANISEHTVRIMLKRVNGKDRAYIYGYIQKDHGLEHYVGFSINFSKEELQTCVDVYRAKATRNSFAGGHKMNKAPHQNEKLVSFTVGNLFTLCVWFVAQHKLSRLHSRLTLPIIVAYALSTLHYRMDEALVTGKNGGNTLDPNRSQAFLQLSLAGPACHTRDVIPLVHTILYGNESVLTSSESDEPSTLPSTAQLAADYDLEAAKELCASLMAAERGEHIGTPHSQTAAHGEPVGTPHSQAVAHESAAGQSVSWSSLLAAQTVAQESAAGQFVVLDGLASNVASRAASKMAEAGLVGDTLFPDQLPNACGYNSAMWAFDLYQRSHEFASMTLEDAQELATASMINACNIDLGFPERGETAVWLEVQDILFLISDAMANSAESHCNAAEHGENPTNIPWLDGVMPINHWVEAFDRSIVTPSEKGKVHIAIVNTEQANSLAPIATAFGAHWFVIAWLVEAGDAE